MRKLLLAVGFALMGAMAACSRAPMLGIRNDTGAVLGVHVHMLHGTYVDWDTHVARIGPGRLKQLYFEDISDRKAEDTGLIGFRSGNCEYRYDLAGVRWPRSAAETIPVRVGADFLIHYNSAEPAPHGFPMRPVSVSCGAERAIKK